MSLLIRILGFVFVVTFCASLNVGAQPSDNVIQVALIYDFSGVHKDQSNQVRRALFENSFNATNIRGLVVGSKTYKIQVVVYDTESRPDVAAVRMRSAVEHDKVNVAVCSDYACAQPAEETKTPLILTGTSAGLSHGESNTFLIKAPGPEALVKQSGLALETLNRALVRADGFTPEKITVSLRKLDFAGDLGAVRFDKAGNNVGLVAYPFNPGASGCTSSCGSTCPSNCGNNSCSKSNGNECCSICGMPRPN